MNVDQHRQNLARLFKEYCARVQAARASTKTKQDANHQEDWSMLRPQGPRQPLPPLHLAFSAGLLKHQD